MTKTTKKTTKTTKTKTKTTKTKTKTTKTTKTKTTQTSLLRDKLERNNNALFFLRKETATIRKLQR